MSIGWRSRSSVAVSVSDPSRPGWVAAWRCIVCAGPQSPSPSQNPNLNTGLISESKPKHEINRVLNKTLISESKPKHEINRVLNTTLISESKPKHEIIFQVTLTRG